MNQAMILSWPLLRLEWELTKTTFDLLCTGAYQSHLRAITKKPVELDEMTMPATASCTTAVRTWSG